MYCQHVNTSHVPRHIGIEAATAEIKTRNTTHTYHPRSLQLHQSANSESFFSSPFKHRPVSGDRGQGLEPLESLVALHHPLQLPDIAYVYVYVCVCVSVFVCVI